MADNLRRSLVAPSQLSWLALSWTLLPGSPLRWTLLVLSMFVFPAYAVASSTLQQLYYQLMVQSHPMNLRMLATGTWEEVRIKVAQFVLNLSFLVEQAFDAVDAVGRTLYRQWWSHRNLLEWTTSAQVEQQTRNGQPRPKLSQLGPVFALSVSLVALVLHPSALLVALPFLLLWVLSPWTKVYLSGHSSTTPSLNDEQRATFRAYARRTWHFFETFVTEADHFLAPDNYQEVAQQPQTHTNSPNTSTAFHSLVSLPSFSACVVLCASVCVCVGPQPCGGS
jgi:cyclic beta-1,2-glucan synthetase